MLNMLGCDVSIAKPNIAAPDTHNLVLSVTDALNIVKTGLESLNMRIIGEVSSVSDKPNYKAVYFTLSDGSAAMDCQSWRDVFARIGVQFKVGDKIEVTGKFSLYAAKGRMSFVVSGIEPAGEGRLRAEVAKLAQKLQLEGLFDAQKQLELPSFPARIGLVTSPAGKAVHDCLRTLRRRYKFGTILFAGVKVEGVGAEQAIIDGIKTLVSASPAPDVILLVRGGGSYEDLMPFNSEVVARAVGNSPIPIITGIGHEPDNSIADMCACLRCSTPTAAAEAVAPNLSDYLQRLIVLKAQLQRNMQQFILNKSNQLNSLASRPALQDPREYYRSQAFSLEQTQERLLLAVQNYLTNVNSTLGVNVAKLDSLSPLGVLARGFAYVVDENGRIIRSKQDAAPSTDITVNVSDGQFTAVVK